MNENEAQAFSDKYFWNLYNYVIPNGDEEGYAAPEIRIARKMNEDQKKLYTMLNNVVAALAYSINPNAGLDEICSYKEEINKTAGFDIVSTIESLEEHLLLPNNHGRYIPKKNIVLCADRKEEEMKETITHEAIHSLRNQVMKGEEVSYSLSQGVSYWLSPGIFEKNGKKYIGMEITEFIAQLNIFACEEMRIEIEQERYSSMADIMPGKKAIGNDIDGLLNRILASYKNGRTEAGKETFLKSINVFAKSADYLLVAEDIPEKTILGITEAINLLYNSLEQPNTADFRLARDIIASEMKPKKLLLNTMREGSSAYKLGQIAITKNYGNLKRNWPKVILMPAEDIESRYIRPVRDKLYEMRQNHA